eukprot:gene9815-biopygen18244
MAHVLMEYFPKSCGRGTSKHPPPPADSRPRGGGVLLLTGFGHKRLLLSGAFRGHPPCICKVRAALCTLVASRPPQSWFPSPSRAQPAVRLNLRPHRRPTVHRTLAAHLTRCELAGAGAAHRPLTLPANAHLRTQSMRP